ncbi:MAG: sodium/proline symporter PutP [Lachnospiraceae bacterium]|nr:sodium/proline symporter PutP [Lachnospiraceae bacterium]
MTISIKWIIASFVLYLAMMIVVGFRDMKSNNSSGDYFLGGRQLNGFVAALSAQASDMSGWLLMGLPGSVYALGTGQIWIAVGLFMGTVLNWIFISTRLRRYTICTDSITLPRYFENRFHDESRWLLLLSSAAILIFFLVYTASALSAGGKLFNTVFGMDYHIALTVGAIVILTYTLLGGFSAVCDTDSIQGSIMFIGLVIVPIIGLFMIGDLNGALAANGVQDTKAFLDPMHENGVKISLISIISQLAWGLGYCGMPHILVRFMAVSSESELKRAKAIGIGWCGFSLAFACLIGVVGRGYLTTDLASIGEQENVFMLMIMKMFAEDFHLPIIGGIFLCGILAAIMSTADSQLLVTASSVTEDIWLGFFRKKITDKQAVWMSRAVVLIVAALAYVIAWNPDNSIMGLVSDAWAGLGSAFGPAVLMSLYWKRTNKYGAGAGIAVGALLVLFWDYIAVFDGKTASTVTGIYSLLVGFIASLIAIVVVSLATKAPDEGMIKDFEKVNSSEVM